jgi:hypothetical protein
MKQLLISIAMVLTLSMNAEASAQKHRHSPRTEQVDSSKSKKDAIEAFSDTTAEDAEDDKYISYRRRTSYSGSDAEDVKQMFEGVSSMVGSGMIIGIVAIVIIFLVAPLLIIATIFYFVNKNRRERYKLAQMAIQNGQQIPDDILKEKEDDWDKNDYQSGMRQIFLGVGLAIFLGIVAGKIGFGIGALVFFIGLGKVFIARRSDQPRNDSMCDNNLNNNSNNSNHSEL